MQTLLLKSNQIDEAGAILRKGGLVAIPTETVYGLAANALDGISVAKIFEAKGRPQDNPLIVHIADLGDVETLAAYVPPVVYDLADAFWPGPLTIILDKSEIVPDEVTAGLDTVAIRMPSHPAARKIIRAAGVPLAAPSANASGKPSPTTAAHVMKDMDGKIDAVVDGGPCEVGVESTVITLATRQPRLLRPGRITPEEIEEVLGDELIIDDAVLGKMKENEKAASPGMKYKHYSPSAEVIIVKGTLESFAKFVNGRAGEDVAALVFDGEEDKIDCKTINFGEENDDLAHAQKLFDALRACDDEGVRTLYVRCPGDEGVGLAVMNRLLRAAEFKVLEV
ncbi:MAG: threonylcarbamoyl-AMP synthase [Clostridia bacterium]|nr:threonylcarbamoyl-AMP synthase [Clostridia bacterium]MBR6512666.1 threonylcarbamoyl-AMP synthase [Clostridia bacterium]